MIYKEEVRPLTNDRVFIIVLSERDFITSELDDLDTLLLEECGKSNKISDKLLALQLVVSSIEKTSKLLKEKENERRQRIKR